MRKNERPSPVFDNYIKLALEKGIISNDPKDLYNVKPDSEYEYENNIMESAHPEPAISFMSYDRLNSLVENNNERQTIMLNIVNKKPTGQLFNTKYANQDLILSLTRLANFLDSTNEPELRKLADFCLFNASNSIKKQAVAPILVGFAAAATLLGILYANQHLANANHGYEKNYASLIKEIDDLLTSKSEWGVGYDLDSELKNDMISFKKHLESFNKLYLSVKPIFSNLQTPRTATQLNEMINHPDTKDIIAAYDSFKTAAEDLYPFMKQIQENFSSDTYKDRHITNKGMLTSVVDYVKLHGGKNLVADDFDDLVMAIPPFIESINEILNILKKAENFKNHALQSLETAKADNPFSSKENKPSQPTSSPPAVKNDINDPSILDKELMTM